MKNQNEGRSESDLKFVLAMTFIFFVLPLSLIAIPGIHKIGDTIVRFMMNTIDILDLSHNN